jgi:hypothetical protein
VSTSTFFHFKYLWLIADEARVRAERFTNEYAPADFGQGLVAVVFAAAAAEAYINEVTHLVKQDTDLCPDTAHHNRLVDFATGMTKAVADWEPIDRKYLLASKLLGQPFSRGQKPLQDLVALIEARNFLVHLTPEPSALVTNLEQLGIASKRGIFRNYLGEDEPVGSQVDALSNPKVAKWACDAAENIIVAVMDMFPAQASASLGLLRFGFPPGR